MQDPERLSEENSATAAGLSQLRPVRPRFDAGGIAARASHRRSRHELWAWRGVAAALAAALMLSLLLRPVPRMVTHEVYVTPLPAVAEPSGMEYPAPRSQAFSDLRPGDDYLAVRNRVLALGVQALRPPAVAPEPPPRAESHEELLLNDLDPFRHGVRS